MPAVTPVAEVTRDRPGLAWQGMDCVREKVWAMHPVTLTLVMMSSQVLFFDN